MTDKTLKVEIAVIKSNIGHIKEKVGEIHKLLEGNGRVGLVEEFNLFKGGVKLAGWIIGSGSLIGIISMVLHFF